MAVNRDTSNSRKPRRPPATTPEAREMQLISLAVDLAEKQLREGKASSQTIVHFLKLASGREKLEREKLERENELLRGRTDQLASGQRTEEMYTKALEAMSDYQGRDDIID